MRKKAEPIDVEALILENKVAEIHADIAPGGAVSNPEWIGEKEWPVYVGYPLNALLERLPWPLKAIREDARTHCTIYVRTDV